MQNQVCLTKLESMCTLLTHNTLKLKSLTFRDFIDIELCHEKHRWPLPNLLWEPHHHWWPLLSWRWIVSLRASSNGDLPQVDVGWFPTYLRPSFSLTLWGKIVLYSDFKFQVELLNWVPSSCCSFQHPFVVNTMNWKLSCICDQNTWHFIYAILFVCYTTR